MGGRPRDTLTGLALLTQSLQTGSLTPSTITEGTWSALKLNRIPQEEQSPITVMNPIKLPLLPAVPDTYVWHLPNTAFVGQLVGANPLSVPECKPLCLGWLHQTYGVVP